MNKSTLDCITIIFRCEVRLADLEEEIQILDTNFTNLDETMITLQISMSDLEDTVDTVEDGITALEIENDEIVQRLTVLEETVIGMIVPQVTKCRLRLAPLYFRLFCCSNSSYTKLALRLG